MIYYLTDKRKRLYAKHKNNCTVWHTQIPLKDWYGIYKQIKYDGYINNTALLSPKIAFYLKDKFNLILNIYE